MTSDVRAEDAFTIEGRASAEGVDGEEGERDWEGAKRGKSAGRGTLPDALPPGEVISFSTR